MTFNNGKFYEDGQVVPLQFGNKDQIRLINNVKQLRDEGAVPSMIFDESQKFICGISLRCVCGGTVKMLWETEEEGYEVEGDSVKCSGCNFIYEVCADDYNFLFFKLSKSSRKSG